VPAFEVFEDFAIVAELGQFVDDYTAWSREIAEARAEYFWNHEVYELPEKFVIVFGFPTLDALELMRSRLRRTVRRIHALNPASEPQDSYSANLQSKTSKGSKFNMALDAWERNTDDMTQREFASKYYDSLSSRTQSLLRKDCDCRTKGEVVTKIVNAIKNYERAKRQNPKV
jgi:hypothetical protein